MGKDVKIGLMVGLGLLALIVIFWSSRPPEEEDSPAAMTTQTEKATPVAKESLGVVAEGKKAQATDVAKATTAKPDSATAEGNIQGVAAKPELGSSVCDALKPDAPTPVVAVSPTTGETTHTVVKSDTLWAIGKKHGVHHERILARNRDILKSPGDLKVGQVLKIPAPIVASAPPTAAAATPKLEVSTAAASFAPEPPKAAPSAAKTHKVAPGDTLYKLAKMYFQDVAKWKAIAQANPQIRNNQLMVGQVLNIPMSP
ncbi:MAG: LysM peptidoglycan-binding domain-containing protein [Planctomycetes bacterium]|nr:LysM peptidoglycan-binding domain-containing protein [Planctomycetota bacterium]MBM4078497.1 LysM peptidoglycan-binding domain-containing protein [Planctomycetota bacterium]MBM4084198.1 LysM peptidoglycan-binding domain-containing protein [Planctomycetota bacterium]